MMIRVIIFIVVVVLFVVIGLLAMAMSFRYRVDAAPPSKQIALCSDEAGINDKINELAFQALDDALRKQVENLFTTWMKDDSGQPERAATGVRRSALAYVHAREAILKWNIPSCS